MPTGPTIASEKVIEGVSAPHQVRSSSLISLFALFAFVFGLLYLTQGVSRLIKTPSGEYGFFVLLIEFGFTFFGLFLGLAATFIGVGLFLRKEWARRLWLVFAILNFFVGVHLTVVQILAGYSGMGRVYMCLGLFILVSAISWAYLSKAHIKLRFH